MDCSGHGIDISVIIGLGEFRDSPCECQLLK